MNRHLAAGVAATFALTLTIINAAGAQTSTRYAPVVSTQVAAREPEPHAARALTDLQFARWMLANVHEENATDPNVDRALSETNDAIVDVGKLLKVEPGKGQAPSDIVRGRDDRLHAALRYLTGAFNDLKAPEDENPPNVWRTRALNRTWGAQHYTELALGIDRRADLGQCRSLRKALTDMTTTREDLNDALSAFGSNRGDAYNDTLRIRNQTNDTIRDLGQSISRQCGTNT